MILILVVGLLICVFVAGLLRFVLVKAWELAFGTATVRIAALLYFGLSAGIFLLIRRAVG